MSRSLSISAGCNSWTGVPFLSSMTLTPKGLSALTEHHGNHFAAGVTLERNLSTYWLGDKDVLAERRGFLRRLAGSLDHELEIRGIHAQTERLRERIVGLEFFELRLG